MALVALSLPMVPGARAAVRGFTARTLGLLTLACLLVAAPATAQVNYAAGGGIAFVKSSPNASSDIVIASTYLGNPVVYIADSAFAGCTNAEERDHSQQRHLWPNNTVTATAIFDSVDISSDLCVHAPPAHISCRCRGMREPYENPTELVGVRCPQRAAPWANSES